MPETKEDIGLVLLDYCRLAREGGKSSEIQLFFYYNLAILHE